MLVRAYDTESEGGRLNVLETIGTGQEGIELFVSSCSHSAHICLTAHKDTRNKMLLLLLQLGHGHGD